MPIDFMMNGDRPERPTILLAHGAGAAMDTPWMTSIAERLAARDMRVARFEFAYMAARRTGGPKRPPPKIDLLLEEYQSAIDALAPDGPLILAGKSMGGRVASMNAEDLFQSGKIAGLLCLGYPFHPRGKPESLRTDHLRPLTVPTLICQGTRDPLGTKEEVQSYNLPSAIRIHWLPDGDHDLKPRKRETGLTLEDHLATTANTIRDWGNVLVG